MTDAQRKYYLRQWAKAAAALGVRYNDDTRRHAEVAAALGEPKRFRDFSNADLDAVLEHFEDLISPDRFNPTGVEDRAKKRLVGAVERYEQELGWPYIQAVLRGKFNGALFYEELDLVQLRQLLYTIGQRAASRRHKPTKEIPA